MKGRWITYSVEEFAWIEARKTLPRRELHAMFVARWRRGDVSAAALASLCKRRGWLTGRTGCFEKGIVPLNKGKPMSPETRAKCAATMFQPGSRSGRADQLYKPIGSERLSKDGYLERKIHDGLPMQSRWRAVHLINWEALHGPIPDGKCLKSRDGNRRNTDPSNWELIDRALLPVLNGGGWGKLSYDEAEPEVKPALMALAKLRIAGRAISKAGAA